MSQKLIIPNQIPPFDDSQHQRNLEVIQRWANALNLNIVNSPALSYASLTGAGQTVTPGALTQAGPLTVNAGAGSGTIVLNSNTGQYILRMGTTSSQPGISLLGPGGFTVTSDICISSNGGVNIASNTSTLQLTGNKVSCDTAAEEVRLEGNNSITLNPGVAFGNSGLSIQASGSSNVNILTDSSTHMTIQASGTRLIFMPNLPTSIPGSSNALWRDSNGFVRIA